MYGDLAALAAVEPRLLALHQTLTDDDKGRRGAFDTVLYLNVLEHIREDGPELNRPRPYCGRVARC